MTWTAPDFTRVDEPFTGDERATLEGFLEEYARHNGHADLLRERIDGTTGS